MVYEEELSSIFNVSNRDGNTLSPIVRKTWDSPPVLHNTVKTNPIQASDPHVSIVGHTTDDELRRTLTAKERANGPETDSSGSWFDVQRRSRCPRESMNGPSRIFQASWAKLSHSLALSE